MMPGQVRHIGAELTVVLLVLLSLLTTFGLVKKAYDIAPPAQPMAARPVTPPLKVKAETSPEPEAEPEPPVEVAEVAPAPEPDPAPAPEPAADPTAPELERLATRAEQQKSAALASDAQVQQQLQETERLRAEKQKWSQRKTLVKGRSRQLDKLVGDLEKSLPTAEQQKASLARVRDEKMKDLVEANAKRGETYSVSPYKGPSGTWRRPIVVDCSGDSVRVLPDGKIHGSAELGPIPNARAISLVYEVRKKAAELQDEISPDGAPGVPYILFVVRPDGIRHYYQARTLLESTRIAFGYELVGQDWVIDVPETTRAKARDERASARARVKPQGGTGRGSAGVPAAEDPDDLYVWPNNTLKGADGPAQSGQPLELPDGQGGRIISGLSDQDRSDTMGPGDLLEPPMRKVPDPRRPSGPDPDGTEIIPGQWRNAGPGNGGTGRNNIPAIIKPSQPGSTGQPGSLVAEPPIPTGGTQAGTSTAGRAPAPGTSASPFAPRTGSSGTSELVASAGGYQQAGTQGTQTPGGSGLTGGGLAPAGPLPQGTAQPGSGTCRPSGVYSPGQPAQGQGATGTVNRLGQVADSLLGTGSGLQGSDSPGMNRAGGIPGNPIQAGQGGAPGSTAGQSGMSPGSQPGQSQDGGGQNSNASPATPGSMSGGSPAPGSTGNPAHSNGPGSPGSSAGALSTNAGSGSSGSQSAQGSSGGSGSSGSQSAQGSSSSSGSGSGSGSPLAGGSGGQGESSWLSTPSGASDGLPPKVSEEWLDIVIACQAHGVTIQPGGYRLTLEKLESATLLNDRLKAIANRHARDDRGRIRRPRLRYVVEAGGQDAFWLARRQSSFIGMDWPATIQLTDSISWDRWLLEEPPR